jgi:hypothetical protein
MVQLGRNRSLIFQRGGYEPPAPSHQNRQGIDSGFREKRTALAPPCLTPPGRQGQGCYHQKQRCNPLIQKKERTLSLNLPSYFLNLRYTHTHPFFFSYANNLPWYVA